MKIALSLIVKNEQRSLLRCLLAAAPLVDLIVIADTGSTDRTKEIIEEFRRHFDDNDAPLPESYSKSLSESPSKSPSNSPSETHGPNRPPVQVYDFPWCNDFSAARNFTLERAEELGADIHFVLDADEYVLSGSYDSLHEFAARMTARHDNDWAAMFIRNDWYPDPSGSGTGRSANGSSMSGYYTGSERKPPLRCSKELCERIFPKGTRYHGIIHEQPTKHSICVQAPVIADHDGYLHDGLGKGKRNLSYLLEALKQAPADPYLHYQTAVTLRNLKRLDESLSYFEQFFEKVCGLFFPESQTESDTTASSLPAPDCPGQNAEDSTLPTEDSALPNVPVYVRDGILRYLYTLMELGTGETMDLADDIIKMVSDLYADSTDFYFFCGNFYTGYIMQDLMHRSHLLPRIEQCYQACLAIGEKPDRAGVAGTGSFLAAYNLGLWYELNHQTKKARECYSLAAEYGYAPAKERL
ncbi:MAG: hypothetical protein K5760_05590, partial [Clostridium sp.]|nr:hypothetical protein [Clostridium sp.]